MLPQFPLKVKERAAPVILHFFANSPRRVSFDFLGFATVCVPFWTWDFIFLAWHGFRETVQCSL